MGQPAARQPGPQNPRNRNAEYASGQRVNVAEFNARIAKEEAANHKGDNAKRQPAEGPETNGGRTLEEQLARAKANFAKSG